MYKEVPRAVDVEDTSVTMPWLHLSNPYVHCNNTRPHRVLPGRCTHTHPLTPPLSQHTTSPPPQHAAAHSVAMAVHSYPHTPTPTPTPQHQHARHKTEPHRVLPWRSTCSLPQGMKSATSPSRNRDSDIFGCSAPPTASDTAATMPRST